MTLQTGQRRDAPAAKMLHVMILTEVTSVLLLCDISDVRDGWLEFAEHNQYFLWINSLFAKHMSIL